MGCKHLEKYLCCVDEIHRSQGPGIPDTKVGRVTTELADVPPPVNGQENTATRHTQECDFHLAAGTTASYLLAQDAQNCDIAGTHTTGRAANSQFALHDTSYGFILTTGVACANTSAWRRSSALPLHL